MFKLKNTVITVVAPVITVDGPSGVGKGTLCNALSKKLQWHILDSGIIYRVLALMALNHQINIDDEEALILLVSQLNLYSKIEPDNMNILFKKENFNQIIHNENVGNTASQIATFPRLREILLQYQRTFRIEPGLIADGRDMGTTVFPDAPVKIFLDASLKERAYRRMQQLQKNGFNVTLPDLLSRIKERDDRDYHRAIAPLMPASDALVLDSTNLSIDKVVIRSLIYIRQILALS